MTATTTTKNNDLLAIHPGALGDLVIFGHLLRMLGGAATLVTGAAKGRLLVGAGLARRAIDIDALPMHEVFAQEPPKAGVQAGDTPKDYRLPQLLGAHARLVSCFAEGHCDAQLRLTAIAGCESASFLPVRPEAEFRGHLLELWCDMLGLDFDPARHPEPWPMPPEWRVDAKRELDKVGVNVAAPYVVMHVGAGSPAKCWPVERFASLARSLQAPVVMVVGEVELDRWPAEKLAGLARQFPLLANPPLEVLAGVLCGCGLYVGNDSGVTHLSAAVGARTLALFGPSDERHFAPLGGNARVLKADSMDAIPAAAAREALAGWAL